MCRPPRLAQAARSADQIAEFRVGNECGLEPAILFDVQQLRDAFREVRELDEEYAALSANGK